MFTNVSIYSPNKNCHPILPNQDDCCEILTMLNTGRFYIRNLPQGTIKNYVENVHTRISKDGGMLICHTVAKLISSELSSWKWKRISGYLVKSFMDVNLNQLRLTTTIPPYFNIDSSSEQVITYLHHHSVVADSQGNYIECLPADFYPINEFLFIPHSSGEKGYILKAH